MPKPNFYIMCLEVRCFIPRRHRCVLPERVECHQVGQISRASSRHIGEISQVGTHTIAGLIHLIGIIHIIDDALKNNTEGRPRPELDI